MNQKLMEELIKFVDEYELFENQNTINVEELNLVNSNSKDLKELYDDDEIRIFLLQNHKIIENRNKFIEQIKGYVEDFKKDNNSDNEEFKIANGYDLVGKSTTSLTYPSGVKLIHRSESGIYNTTSKKVYDYHAFLQHWNVRGISINTKRGSSKDNGIIFIYAADNPHLISSNKEVKTPRPPKPKRTRDRHYNVYESLTGSSKKNKEGWILTDEAMSSASFQHIVEEIKSKDEE